MLYSLGIEILLFLLKIVALFSKKTAFFLSTRLNIIETIAKKLNPLDSVLWFHCASLGEFEQARPLIELCKKEFLDCKVLITFFSPSGYTIQKDYTLANCVTYLPFDRKNAVKRFINTINPKAVFLIKYEFWPNLICQLHKKNIPIFSIASIFRKNQLFFKFYGFFMRKKIRYIDYFFVQNKESLDLLKSIEIENAMVIGDTRIDRVLSILKQNNEIEDVRKFIQDDFCFVVGSSWPEDYTLFCEALEQNNNIKTIIAPHQINENTLYNLEKQFAQACVRLSKFDNNTNKNILIIDSIGLLTKIYSYADVVYVGGGMGTRGLHNTLEPAVFGIPILIGKNYRRHQEALDLVALGGMKSLKNKKEFTQFFSRILTSQKLRRTMGESNFKYVKQQFGATTKIVKELKRYLH